MGFSQQSKKCVYKKSELATHVINGLAKMDDYIRHSQDKLVFAKLPYRKPAASSPSPSRVSVRA
jgi:hypothetical protein